MTAVAQACDVCGGVDAEPRHIVEFARGQAPLYRHEALIVAFTSGAGRWAIEDLTSRDRTVRHIQCCAEVGCPVGYCTKE